MKYRKETIDINKLVYPILLNYILTSVFELLDEAIVGHYSVEGFALVGIAASLIYSITGALGILSAAFNILAADRKGKEDKTGFEQIFISSKNLAILIGGIFLIVSMLLGSIFFHKVYGLEGQSLKDLLSYFYPAVITVLQNMLIFQYSAYFRNKLNTRIGLSVTFISTVVNLFFDYSLVYGKFGLPSLGISGAAWGSVIGLFCGLLIYQAAYYRNIELKFIISQLKRKDIFLQQIKELLTLYPALLGQELIESTILVFIITAVVARLGSEQMAVYKLLDIVCSTIGLPAYAYATATQTYALQNHAADETIGVKRYLKAGIYSGILVIATLCILCIVWRMHILQWILSDTDVTAFACRFLWLIFLIVLIKVPYQVYMNYLQGIGHENFVFIGTVTGTILVSISIPVLGHYLNLAGIYLATLLEYAILGLIYRKKAKLTI